MSLRRSARVASSTLVADVNTSNGDSSYKRIVQTTASTKKRKTKTSTTSPTQPVAGKVASTTKEASLSDLAVPSLPTTPLPKRHKAASQSPTPSGVGRIAKSQSSPGDPPLESLARLGSRPAEPHITNAPLATPGGSRVVAYSSSPVKPEDPSPAKKRKAKERVAPDVGAVLPASTDIDHLLKQAEAYLIKVDPRLQTLIEKHHCDVFSPEGLRKVVDPFTELSGGIMGQQISGKAAASIQKKFTALFPETHPAFPSPAQVTSKDIATLRTAGLSQRKAEYISGLAEKFASGELSASMLVSASDEELIEKLVAVRGLGRWSVEMFACFGLKRMDVFATGDLGVQRGMAVYMGRDVDKLKNKGGKWKYMSEQEMLDIASRFSPYRSLFMWYMWRIVDVDVSVMQTV
ncbi:3-methyladenine DNA glycosylase [Coniothyrium glycines]